MKMNEFQQKVRAYFEQFTPDELKNFEQLVRDFNEKEDENTLFGTITFEQYKAEYQTHLNKEHSDKLSVINYFRARIETALKSHSEQVRTILTGKNPPFNFKDFFDKYWYYTQRIWIFEMMKFRNYLTEQSNKIEFQKIAQRVYFSPFNYDVFTQDYKDYFNEVKAKRSKLTSLILHNEKEQFEYFKEMADLALNGFDLKNPPSQDYIESRKIDLKYLNIQNPKQLFDNCFLILEFLNKQTPAEPEPAEPEIQNTIPETTIQFDKPETIEKLHSELKGFFVGNENELLRALQGKTLEKKLLFNSNQNKFVEVFKRLKYNGYLLSQPVDIKNWICTNFEYHYKKGEISETRVFNTYTVHDILTKEKGEPRKPERICQPEWLPYKTATERNKE